MKIQDKISKYITALFLIGIIMEFIIPDRYRFILAIIWAIYFIWNIINIVLTENKLRNKTYLRYGKKRINYIQMIVYVLIGSLFLLMGLSSQNNETYILHGLNSKIWIGILLIFIGLINYLDFKIMIDKNNMLVKQETISRFIKIRDIIDITIAEKITIVTKKNSFILNNQDFKEKEREEIKHWAQQKI